MLSRFTQLREELGSGAEGICYSGIHHDGSRVCVKLADMGDAQAVAGLRHEYAVHMRVAHPALPRMFAFGQFDATRVGLVRDYAGGDNLAAALSGRTTHHRRSVIAEAARALDALHDVGLLHGDLKPAHIIVARHGAAVAFIDLGMSVLLATDGSMLNAAPTESASRGGTLPFAAPELTRSASEKSRASDTYAFAVSVIACVLDAAWLSRAHRDGAHAAALASREELAFALTGKLADALIGALRPEAALRTRLVALADAAESPVVARPARRSVETPLVRDASTLLQPLFTSSAPRRSVVSLPGSPTSRERLQRSLSAAAVQGGASVVQLSTSQTGDPNDGWLEALETALQLPRCTTLEARIAAVLESLGRAAVREPLMLVIDATSRAASLFLRGIAGEGELIASGADTVRGRVAVLAPLGAAADTTVAMTLDIASLRAMADVRASGRAVSDAMLEALAASAGSDHDALDDGLIALAGGSELEDALQIVASQRAMNAGDVPYDIPEAVGEVLSALALLGGRASHAMIVAGLSNATENASRDAEAAGWISRRVTSEGDVWELERTVDASQVTARDRNRISRARRLADALEATGELTRAGHLHLVAGDWQKAAAMLVPRAQSTTDVSTARAILAPLVDYAVANPRAELVEALRSASELSETAGELRDVLRIDTALVSVGADTEDDLLRALRSAIALGAYDIAETIDTRAVAPTAAVLAQRSRLALHRGALDRARASAAAAQELASTADIAEVLHAAGLVDFYRGKTRRAARVLERAAKHVDAKVNPALAASIATSRGLAAHKSGDLARAARHYRRSARASERAGDVVRMPARLLNLGTAAQDAHDYGAAFDAYTRAATSAARVGSDRDRVRVGYNLANLALTVGALDMASTWLRMVTPIAQASGMRVEAARLALLAAEVALASESAEHARAALVSFASYSGDRDSQLKREAARVHTKLALLEGDILRARLAIADIAEHDADSALLAARIELRDEGGRTERIADLLAKADGSSPLLAWQAALIRAELAERTNAVEELDDAVASARHFFRKALSTLPAQYVATYQTVPAIAREVRRLSSLWGQARGAGGSSMLERVLRVNRKLNVCNALDELLETILDEASALTGAERALALVVKNDAITIAAQRALAPWQDDSFSRTLAEQVIQTAKPLVTHNAMADERFMEQRSVRDLKLRSIACVPLLIDGVSRGAIYVDHRVRESAFTPDTTGVLTAFAEQASLAIKAAELRLALLDDRRALEVARSNLQTDLAQTTEQLERAQLRLAATADDDMLREKFSQIVARSRGMLDVLDKVQRFASVPLPIFVHGESGAGKELIARALHTHSPRSAEAFVAVNCAAIPTELLESELFGVKRGAFTGAVNDRQGLFRVADRGTLFLDEVGDMAPAMQAKLLRVLEEGTFRSVGATEEQTTDVRIVCASHKSLVALTQSGRFREDLFYRLAGALIELPPLRERAEDIPELVRSLLTRASQEFSTGVPKVKRDVLDALQAYSWPGNVRELDNELRRALALADGELRLGHFSKAVRSARLNAVSSMPTGGKAKRYREAVASFEKHFLSEALAANDNDPSRAARAIGISRSGIYAKLKSHRLLVD